MQPYQEEYIANLNAIIELATQKKPKEQLFEEYYAVMLANQEKIGRRIQRNIALLRDHLFPMLDNLFEAKEEELCDLQEFAGKLLDGRNELDVGLFCQIHQALLSMVRSKKNRQAMIRELYWLGIGRNNLYNKMIGLSQKDSQKYVYRMRLCFAEAAAYLKYYDEIEDRETRGYILRSRANMALGAFPSVSERTRLIKRTLQIMQDKGYQEKEPELPWDQFIYQTHQLMAAAISYSKEKIMTPQDIADIMESVYIVYQRRLKEAKERGEQLPVRPLFSYYAIEYYCGLDTLDGLLTKMEDLMDAANPFDVSVDGMYGIISLPAFYCQYLQDYPEKIPEREEYIESLYRRILNYVENFPEESKNETLFYYLRQLSYTFVETKASVSYKEFLQKLQVRFAPEIFIHSNVVGRAAATFCNIIIKEQPSFFDDIEEVKTIKNPEKKRHAVVEYAMECGLFHDVGKINFINLYSQTGRQWFEEEYEMAHLHTIIGEACLSERESTRLFAAIAKGHHSWYDGSRGYPETYRRLECPYRQMVDVVGVVDWLDNVTTSSRRIYTGVEKTFDEAICEAIALEGKRFSPILTAMLRDKKVSEQIKAAFEEGRREAYQKLYKENW